MSIQDINMALLGAPTTQSQIGGDPGTYVAFKNDSHYPVEPSKSVAAVIVETKRGSAGRKKITSRQQFVEEYGHDPLFSKTTYAALNHLQEATAVQVIRPTGGATAGAAVLAVIPPEDSTPEGLANQTALLPIIVGESDKPLKLSNDMALAFVSRSPGKENIRIQLVPELRSPLGGFIVKILSGRGTESYHCTLGYKKDGYGRQMNIAERINAQSRSVRVVLNNPTEVDFELDDSLINKKMEVRLGGAFDGERLMETDIIESLAALLDTEKVRMTTLVGAGWVSPSIHQAMIGVCNYRQDSFALLDSPRDCDTVEAHVDYRQNHLAADTSYAALYSDYYMVYDQYASMRTDVPPSAVVAGVVAHTDRNYGAHYAPAGMSRGNLDRFGVDGFLHSSFSRPERATLARNQINATRSQDEVGVFLWNDSTLEKLESALSFVGTCRMRNALYVALTMVCDRYTFDPQSQAFRDKIDESCRDLLKKEQRAQAIGRFRTGFDSVLNTPRENDAGRLHYKIFYTPINSNRQLFIGCHITNSAVNIDAAFNAAQGELV